MREATNGRRPRRAPAVPGQRRGRRRGRDRRPGAARRGPPALADMVATRTYLTGGVGSRHRDEAFGDPYELPPDQAYAETCAAIASVMLAWRLLLATGEPRFADDRADDLQRGAAGLSLDGTSFFYVNPLQRRSHRVGATTPTGGGAWYPCACCPPNLMRPELMAAVPGDDRRRRASRSSSTRPARSSAASAAGARPAGRRDRLSRGAAAWPSRCRDARRRHGRCRSACRAGADRRRLIGRRRRAAGCRWTSAVVRERRAWRPGETVVLDLAMPGRSHRARPARRCGPRAASRSSAGRSCTASRPRTCPPARSSRTSRSTRPSSPRPSPATTRPGDVGLTDAGARSRRVGRTRAAATAPIVVEADPLFRLGQPRARPCACGSRREGHGMKGWTRREPCTRRAAEPSTRGR